jgi:hypothetical protein
MGSHIIDGRWMCILDGILTDDECQKFIADLDKAERLETVDKGFALYDRAIMISPEWAEKIRGRIIDLLPEEVRSVCVLNTHFRFSKYNEGGYFNIHRDGINVDDQGRYSIYTVNIFLNSNFTGGETDFFDQSGKLVIRAVPAAGRGSIFDTNIYHSGNSVHGGYKYLLRTDVLIPRPKMVF